MVITQVRCDVSEETGVKELSESEIMEINQDICRKLVDREVIYCVSGLVDHFAKNNEALDGSDYDAEDDLWPLLSRKDWLEPALRELGDMDRDELIEALDELFDVTEGDASTDDIRKMLRDELESADSEKQMEFCEERGVDPDEDEVYEHWIVSDFFKRRLDELGEATGELFGMDIWGRTCTGQAIYCDGVIEKVARGMEILYGQKYWWHE